jgi:hypothetical protein
MIEQQRDTGQAQEKDMAIQAWFRRANDWTVRHPWLTTLIWSAVLILVFWLLPPRNSFGSVALKVVITMAAVLSINFLRYRSFFPMKQRIREDEAKAAKIAESVRSLRERDSMM